MPNWNKEYYTTLEDKFSSITEGLSDNLDKIVDGRVTPALEDISIGTGRKMRAATLFFDIRGFTKRTSADDKSLKETLMLLDCVIPMVMQIIYDYEGYIEKNTGDGIMALIGVEKDDETAANNALSAATTIFYVLKNLINPFLESIGIAKVDARIGIDMGTVLISRVGLPTGTSKIRRNFLTVIGPSANLSSKLQGMAGTNEIWTGDLIYSNAREARKKHFRLKSPKSWTWIYQNSPEKTYNIWLYNAVRTDL
jgi:adenylate cyclase